MSESTESVPEGGMTTQNLSTMEGVRSSISAYRWALWIVLLEAVLLLLAVVLNSVLGAKVIAGLLGAVVIVIAVVGAFVLVSLVVYRVAVGRGRHR